MRTIYRDSDFKCHSTNPDGAYTSFETDYFDGKCDKYVEGYRVLLDGESWTRMDGTVFHGEMYALCGDYSELDAAQREYERQLLAEYEAALAEIEKALGV